MTVKQQGGVFGRNPEFNTVTANSLDVNGTITSDGANLDGVVVINESGADVDFRVESDTNANMLFVDASSNSVGVGTNTPATTFEASGSGFTTARFTRSNGMSSSNIIEFANDVDGITGQIGGVAGGGVLVRSGTTEVFRTDNSGNIVFPSGQGIDFSATSGTGTSELFDDYEEGTFTVTDTSGAGLTFAQEHGFYTKVGRLVHCHIFVQYPSTANGSNAKLGGLPFTSASLGASMGGAIGATTSAATAFTIGQSSTEISLYTGLTAKTNANMSTSFNYITVTYQAA